MDIDSKGIPMKQLCLLLFLLNALAANAQEPSRFKEQVELLASRECNFSADKQRVVFTGSSSIVRWKSVQSDFPAYHIINHGFGGSQFSDLLHFYDELVLKPKPDILLIYEGDNDVAQGKDVELIFKQAKELHMKIQQDLPKTKVVFISPKPSIAKWGKKDDYIKLNNKLKEYCGQTDMLEFADVWTKMVDENGVVFQDIFVEDGDHMNAKGYTIWVEVVGAYLR
jgi:lysophospholipase L1-like esterase